MEQENLKKLKRDELLEIIVRQKKRIEELEKHISSLEHTDDQTIHLSITKIGSWSETLRTLADALDCGSKTQSAKAEAPAVKETSSAIPSERVSEPFDWGWEQPRSKMDRIKETQTVGDASFIELDK